MKLNDHIKSFDVSRETWLEGCVTVGVRLCACECVCDITQKNRQRV